MKKPELLRRGEDMIKKEMIAMLLAGGQGSRLGVLTAKVAKPAVAFGGKYRIIDFPLSNCINSGIDTVGVLTQYQPLRLNTHIGIGIPMRYIRTYDIWSSIILIMYLFWVEIIFTRWITRSCWIFTRRIMQM